jgi:hypothetical protein
MSSRTVALSGVQTPRVRLAPHAKHNDYEDASFLASAYGLTPDEWQENVLEGWLGIRHDGKWAAPRCGLAVPRQNGKNGVLEVRELYGMIVKGERFLHTAHEVKTARKAFLRLLSFFENAAKYPELAALVKEIRKTNGQEAIVLDNGGSVEFVARSKGSGRGFSVDVLVMDEAQELGDEALEALLPTISASPNPQQILTGTPPGPTANGDVFRRMRDEGVEGKSRRLCWLEWSCDGDGVDLDARENWAQANPALGIRLSWDTVSDERGAFSDDGFARERLGMWASSSTRAVIDPQSWSEIADVESFAAERFALAVDVSPDMSMASVALAGHRADGLWHVELDEQRPGISWLVPYITRLVSANPQVRAVVVDAASPAAAIIDELSRAKIKVTTSGARDMAHACGQFYSGVYEGWLRHTDQPQLNVALSVARKRPLLDNAWGWNRKNATSDITPLVACTLALWGAQSSTAKKPMRKPSDGRRAVVM